MTEQIFYISFHCFYPGCDTPCRKEQKLKLSEIPRWIDSYKFTHPNCTSIAVKVWFSSTEE